MTPHRKAADERNTLVTPGSPRRALDEAAGCCCLRLAALALRPLRVLLAAEGSTGSRRAGPCRAWGPCSARRPLSTDGPARSRFGSAGHHVCDSVTNAARPGNDL